MRKYIKKSAFLFALIVAASALSSCGGQKEPAKDYSGMEFTVGAYRDLRTDPYNNSYSIGADKFSQDYPGAVVNFVIHKNNEELVTAIASNDVWDLQLSIMSPTVAVFRQDVFEPLDDYIDKNNKIYSKELMDEACVYNGKTYGISNVMMSDVLYAVYNENMYKDYGIKTPYEYYEEGNWSWDSFLKMVDDLKKNQLNMAMVWTKPYLNRRYGLVWNDDYSVSRMYDSQEQRDWLNFVRTIVYDKGMTNSTGGVAKRENAFRLEILPHILVAATGANSVDTIRYIPWVTKDGKHDKTYFVDYHFCVPKGAKSIDGSVELANYMIEACTEDRTQMYKNGMTQEDFAIFEDAMKDFYTIRDIEGYGYSEKNLINEFISGKPVSQHIAEIKDSLDKACSDHNKKVQEKKNSQAAQ
ncbi:MAG: hypothetical protein N2171_02245 [Clostridia bacterium]|nr:hypothetical protein [Clostridia bacterium]